jgi:hypothetical protein
MVMGGVLGFPYLGRADQVRRQGWAQAKSVATGLHDRTNRDMVVIVHADSPALRFYTAIAARVSIERTRQRQALD